MDNTNEPERQEISLMSHTCKFHREWAVIPTRREIHEKEFVRVLLVVHHTPRLHFVFPQNYSINVFDFCCLLVMFDLLRCSSKVICDSLRCNVATKIPLRCSLHGGDGREAWSLATNGTDDDLHTLQHAHLHFRLCRRVTRRIAVFS